MFILCTTSLLCYRPPQQRQAQSTPSQRQPAPTAPHYAPQTQQRQPPTANGYQTPLPQARAAVTAPAAVPKPTAALTSVAAPAAPAPAPSNKGDDDDKSGLSKAQKKRLRKKMREGGA